MSSFICNRALKIVNREGRMELIRSDYPGERRREREGYRIGELFLLRQICGEIFRTNK